MRSRGVSGPAVGRRRHNAATAVVCDDITLTTDLQVFRGQVKGRQGGYYV